MSRVIPALCGAIIAVGMLRLRAVVVTRHPPGPGLGRRRTQLASRQVSGGIVRLVGVGAVALVITAISNWPVIGVLAGLSAWWAPTVWARRGRHHHEQRVVEAVATWTEQLRDTLSAASGLEHAVLATAQVAHGPLADELVALADATRQRGLARGLEDFARRVGHPSADFVAAALITATRHEARDLAPLLGQLAISARDEAALRRRVWVARARTRTASRMIIAVIIVVVGGLAVVDPGYLAAYESLEGQMVLSMIGIIFLGSFVVMERWGRLAMPERFSLRPPASRRVGP